MSLFKNLTKKPATLSALAWLGSLYIWLVDRSTRWDVHQPPETAKVIEAGGPVIVCPWHSRILILLCAKPPGRDVYALISGHSDGLLISKSMRHLGVGTVKGSTGRSGVGGLKTMNRVLEANAVVFITPDGPRGPRMRVKMGAIKAAQLSGAPLIPLGTAVTRCRFLRSWDRFCLPYPFGRGMVVFGKPLWIPEAADEAQLEERRLELEEQLHRVTAEADQRSGLALTEPAPAREPPRRKKHARP